MFKNNAYFVVMNILHFFGVVEEFCAVFSRRLFAFPMAQEKAANYSSAIWAFFFMFALLFILELNFNNLMVTSYCEPRSGQGRLLYTNTYNIFFLTRLSSLQK